MSDFRRYGGISRNSDILRQGGIVVQNSLKDDLIVFKSALAIIMEHGWIQGRGGNLEDGVCFKGGLQAAAEQRYTATTKVFRHEWHPATWRFIKRRIAPFQDIPEWNDEPGRTETQVIALYDAVIEYLERELRTGAESTAQEAITV